MRAIPKTFIVEQILQKYYDIHFLNIGKTDYRVLFLIACIYVIIPLNIL